MLQSYLKIALRTLWKHRTHTLINVVGLAVASAACLLLFLTASFHLSFDRFHTKAGRIFQPYFLATDRDGSEKQNGSMPHPLLPALKAEFPEVEGVTRIRWSSGGVRYGDKTFSKMVRSCDPDFLTMFTFPMVKGEAKTALNDLGNVVISQNMAKDVFGKEDPMGKTLLLNQSGSWKNFVVTGILSDFPDNSTEQYDAFIRTENAAEYQTYKADWSHSDSGMYIMLAQSADRQAFEKKLEAFMQKYMGPSMKERQTNGYAKNSRGQQISLLLEPLTDVHFNTDLGGGGQGISKTYVYALLLIGLFILAIACINFINLTIAQSVTRSREVGVRKSLGAGQGQLMGQVWGETGLLCLVSLVLGLVLAYGLMPEFNKLLRTHLSLASFLTPTALLAIGGGLLVVTLVVGGYPSWVVARFNAVEVLKGKLQLNRPGLLRNALIVTQFTIACLLTACTLVMVQQLGYLHKKPLGLNQDQVISIPIGSDLDSQTALRQLRNQLAGKPGVVSVSGTGVNIGNGLDGNNSRYMYGFMYNKRELLCDWLRVDFDYLKTMQIKLLAGRDFNPAFSTDSSMAVLVSQRFAKQMGDANPIGKFIQPDSAKGKFQVVGVVADFNLYSLHRKAEPLVLHLDKNMALGYLLVRVAPQNLTEAMETVKAAWKTIAPKQEFNGSFVSENTERWYRKEQRLSTIFTTAAGIAILLSCMGLFAVALISIEQRTKEIGVRKVLGASVGSLVALLSKDFLRLVGVAIVLATPLAWWAMRNWLGDFAYKISMPWWVFALTGGLAVVIAFVTIAFQSVRAALMNPVKSLRSE
ncbi:ABC transporter permease [Fibrella sp. HMF5335]|uniref:ABC transporter permease n=1 Tax=Fibrella rubiginis TaxID=2817060 RepID=A0A939K1S2_9BACT|nr:ABC transporter permease [Fibrella rubiginis]MBO0937447.1 ABC transporter permease [Fibrella rubiginis]